jgi:hypothetical protein
MLYYGSFVPRCLQGFCIYFLNYGEKMRQGGLVPGTGAAYCVYKN